jgi:biotin-dependent carboxylase-like uncharacterized protein
MIRVHKPGLATTVQDQGRFGYYEIGMPPAGAMDHFASSVGNDLVGNPRTAAVLEATYIGPELEFTESRLVALTGADVPAKVNGESVPPWEALLVRSGDVLSFDYLTSGARIYIAVSGGIDVPEYLGSRSTYTLTGIGGFQGRKLQEGDDLPLGADPGSGRSGVRLPDADVPTYPSVAELRIIVGLCSYRLAEESRKRFLETEWRVTPDADRVGYRYRGGTLEFVDREQPFGAGSNPANVVDLGYPLGSIQVPGGVEPIVLLNDAVTGGGYATIGTVISVDRDRLAQTKTGDRTRFVAVELADALQARREGKARLERIRQSLRR